MIPTVLQRFAEAPPAETRAGLAALVMLDLGIVLAPAHAGQPTHDRSEAICAGTLLLGDPALEVATAPPRLVIRDTIHDPRDPDTVYTLALRGRNVSLRTVECVIVIELSAPGYLAKSLALSVSNTGGKAWSPPFAMNEARNPAFFPLPPLLPGGEQEVLLRVLFSPLAETTGAPVAFGLTLDATVVQTQPRPARRLSYWRWFGATARRKR